MGFEIPRRTARIILEDDYEGAEITCALDVDMGTYFHFQGLIESEDAAHLEKAFREFGDRILIEWNLEEDGEPLPATAEGVMQLPPALALAILGKWSEAVGEAPAPLSGRSSGPRQSARRGARRHRS